MSKYDGVRHDEMHDNITYKSIDFVLDKFLNKNSIILDVGCSVGKLLYHIKQKGYKNLYGIEPSPKCKLIAKQKFGLKINTDTLDTYKPKI